MKEHSAALPDADESDDGIEILDDNIEDDHPSFIIIGSDDDEEPLENADVPVALGADGGAVAQLFLL